jgi:4-diphosphocytidyl-2-C-methyl-D-erythritol kinase
MKVAHTKWQVRVIAPAKLNLYLEVLGRREDGFHEIQTLMCPVDLCDTLTFCNEPSEETIRLTCDYALGVRRQVARGGEPFPENSDNIVIRAVQLLRRHANQKLGARVHLVKRIPVAAGMAGGSSDAAAALVAGNLGWRLGLSRAELHSLAAELGSDVPFFLYHTAAVCRGRGEQVEPVTLGGLWHFVVVRPPEGLSTAEVYRRCGATQINRPAKGGCQISPLLEALQKGSIASAADLLRNDLQAPAESLSPWIGRMNSEFARLDVLGHQMSGSGTSYFGICRHARHARRVRASLQARGIGDTYAVRSNRQPGSH